MRPLRLIAFVGLILCSPARADDDVIEVVFPTLLEQRRVKSALSMTFAPNGQSLAVASHDSVRIWNLKTKKLQAPILQTQTRAIAFSPNSETLAVAALPTTKLWDLTESTGPRELPVQYVLFARFSKDGKNLITAELSPPQVAYWDLSTGKRQKLVKLDFKDCLVIDISPDESQFALGNYYGAVHIFDVEGRLREKLDKQPNRINALAYSSDGKTLAIAVEPDRVILWDFPNKHPRLNLNQKELYSSVRRVAFIPGRSVLGVIGSSRELLLVDSNKGQHLARFRGNINAGSMICVAFSSDGSRAGTVDNSGDVLLWDIPDFPPQVRKFTTMEVGAGRSNSISLSPNNQWLAVAGEYHLRIWDVKSTKIVKTINVKDSGVGNFSLDNQRFISVTREAATIYDVNTWDAQQRIPMEWASFTHFAKDGKTLLRGDWLSQVESWDLATGMRHKLVKTDFSAPCAAAVSPDERQYAFANGVGQVTLFDKEGKQFRDLERQPGRISSLAYSSDNKMLASVVEYRQVAVWNLTEKRPPVVLNLKDICKRPESVAFLSGTHLLGVLGGNRVFVFDCNSGKHVATLWAGQNGIRHWAISRAGSLAVAIDSQGQVMVWQIPNLTTR